MKISVALCTYNGDKYLDDQLTSILQQSLLPNEIIICDDKSIDSTATLLSQYKEIFTTKNIVCKVFVNEENIGIVNNFSAAISECTGDIIFLSDQDDYWLCNKIEKTIQCFHDNPNAGYVFSNAFVVDEYMAPTSKTMFGLLNFCINDFNLSCHNQVLQLIKYNVVTGCTLAFKKKYINYILPMPENFLHDAWIAIILSSIHKGGAIISDATIKYRQHNNQTVGASVDNTYINRLLRDYYNKEVNKKYYHKLSNILRLAAERISSSLGIEDDSYKLLQRGASHYYAKYSIYSSNNLLYKLKIIYNELATGNYKLFANNYCSAIKDILI